MTLRLSARSRARVGIALGPERLTAVRLGRPGKVAASEAWSRSLEPPQEAAGEWTDLAAALEELRRAFDLESALAGFALLPPLASVRRIDLPRIRSEELRCVIARDAVRYFVGPDEPREVAVTTFGRTRASPVPYVVAAAEARLLERIYRAAEAIEWSIECIVPAHEAWCSVALSHWPVLRRRDGWLVVLGDAGTDALGLDRGRLTAIRRFGLGALERCATELTRSGAKPVALIGSGSACDVLRAKVIAHSGEVLDPPESGNLTSSPEVLAAQYADRVPSLELAPSRVRHERVRRSSRLNGWLLRGAVASLALAGGIEVWGTHRELDAVKAERAALRASVAQAIQAREALEGVNTRLRVLSAIESRSSRWTRALISLAENLPDEAHLTGLRGEADSLVLEGVARRAAPVFESLASSPTFATVRAAAPIRQEASDSGPTIERFTLAARVGTLTARDPAR